MTDQSRRPPAAPPIDQARAEHVSTLNRAFWDELCGSVLARSVGVTDVSAASLARFDRAYLDFYPYLLDYLPLSEISSRRVVEIGLGYGTVGQQLLQAGASYTGVDLALGPAAMMNYRAGLLGRPPCALRGSALSLPLAAESTDCVVAIGCFHHTGSVEQCIRETYRVLKPGGRAVVMVYNQFSYRHWLRWPVATARASFTQRRLDAGETAPAHQRKRYDVNSAGQAAPETVFLSVPQLRHLFRDFRSVDLDKENNSDLLHVIPRRPLLNVLGRRAGLDIYVRAVK